MESCPPHRLQLHVVTAGLRLCGWGGLAPPPGCPGSPDGALRDQQTRRRQGGSRGETPGHRRRRVGALAPTQLQPPAPRRCVSAPTQSVAPCVQRLRGRASEAGPPPPGAARRTLGVRGRPGDRNRNPTRNRNRRDQPGRGIGENRGGYAAASASFLAWKGRRTQDGLARWPHRSGSRGAAAGGRAGGGPRIWGAEGARWVHPAQGGAGGPGLHPAGGPHTPGGRGGWGLPRRLGHVGPRDLDFARDDTPVDRGPQGRGSVCAAGQAGGVGRSRGSRAAWVPDARHSATDPDPNLTEPW